MFRPALLRSNCKNVNLKDILQTLNLGVRHYPTWLPPDCHCPFGVSQPFILPRPGCHSRRLRCPWLLLSYLSSVMSTTVNPALSFGSAGTIGFGVVAGIFICALVIHMCVRHRHLVGVQAAMQQQRLAVLEQEEPKMWELYLHTSASSRWKEVGENTRGWEDLVVSESTRLNIRMQDANHT